MKSTSLIATALAAVLAASASIASANAGENKAAVAHRAQLTDVSAACRDHAHHHYFSTTPTRLRPATASAVLAGTAPTSTPGRGRTRC